MATAPCVPLICLAESPMPHELSVGGIFLPGPLLLGLLLFPVFWLLDRVLARFGTYRRAAHPSLLRIALFVLVYAGAVLALF